MDSVVQSEETAPLQQADQDGSADSEGCMAV